MPAAHPIWRLACSWRTRMHISGSQVPPHAQTHALAHHRARTHTTTPCAYGRAAGKRAATAGKNRSKLHVGLITISDGAKPAIVVKSAVFAPANGNAEKAGWQVSALPRVIPTLTKGARSQLGVLLQIQTKFIKQMPGISQFGLRTADKNTLIDAGRVTVQRKSSDKTTWVTVTVENGHLSE